MKKYFYLMILAAYALVPACTKSDGSPAMADAGGGAGGSLARYTVVGNFLYLVDQNSLNTYDISNPASMALKSKTGLPWGVETIYPYKDKLFLGSQTGMYVFALVNPAEPSLEGAVSHVRACDPVVANDSVAYVTLRSTGTGCGGPDDVLNVYNVKGQQPVLVKSEGMQSPYGLGIKNKALYVCESTNGLVVFNIENGYAPMKLHTLKDEVYYDVIPYGDLLICHVEKGIRFYDISDELDPKELGKVGY